MRACTIYYDPETGEMRHIDWSPTFERETPLLRLDVLIEIHTAIAALKINTTNEVYPRKSEARSERR